VLFAVAATVAAPGAFAHPVIDGVEGFPALMLHPFVVPEQFMCLAGACLVAGRLVPGSFLRALLAAASGMLAGKAAQLAIPAVAMFWYAPMLLTAIAGLAVASLSRIAFLPGLLLVFLLMSAFGVAILPETPAPWGLYEALAASALSVLLSLLVAGLPLAAIASPLGTIAVRIAGAWLAAISLMYLALAWRLVNGMPG
jgi:hypothetical protein